MNRIEINVQTGERKTIALTQAEIDDAVQRTAEEAAQSAVTDAARVSAELRVQAVEALLAKEALDPLAPDEVKDYAAELSK